MFRIAGSAFGFALVASLITGGNKWAILLVFFGVIAVYVWALAVGGMKLKCPYCGKRVKLRATVCHHCGRAVVGAHAGER